MTEEYTTCFVNFVKIASIEVGFLEMFRKSQKLLDSFRTLPGFPNHENT
jgi:hypothetical protein